MVGGRAVSLGPVHTPPPFVTKRKSVIPRVQVRMEQHPLLQPITFLPRRSQRVQTAVPNQHPSNGTDTPAHS